MTIDEERREAARRLREAASYYESMERDVDFYPVESAIGLEAAGETTYTTESVRSLADLIDPDTTSEQTNHDEISLSASPIDRDALLRLARYMDKDVAETEAHFSNVISTKSVSDYARRIREACGEAS